MKDPARLLEQESGRALELLRAGRDVPAPAAGALEQTMLALALPAAATAALGAGTAEAAATGTTATGAAATGAAVTGTAPAAAQLAPWIAVAKWVAGGFALGAAGSTALVATQDWQATEAPRPAASTSSEPRLASSAAPFSGRAAPDPAATPSAPRPDPTSSTSRPRLSTPARSAPALAEETQRIDAARRALDRGDPITALALLDEYAARFGVGQLEPEAALLRVRALSAAGRAPAARALAERLLERANDPDYAARVREAANLEAP